MNLINKIKNWLFPPQFDWNWDKKRGWRMDFIL